MESCHGRRRSGHAGLRSAESPQRANCAGFITTKLWRALPDLRRTHFSLFARFEAKLEQFNGNLPRAVVELAKDWRTDRVLRHLEALLLVADTKNTYILSGNGDVIEPDENVAAIGSGGPFRAFRGHCADAQHEAVGARRSSKKSMKIAGKTCIYTNDNVTFEELD